MDLREYEQRKFAIADILRQMETAASDKQQWRNSATALFTRLAEDRFNLVLVGRFSRGKSSLVNAILGRDSLPTGIIPLTSVITSVSYGSVERVMLRFTRGFMDQEVPLSKLRSYVTQEQNPGNVKGIKEAEVQLPAEFLRRGFHFVDTPGLGSAIEENTRTTESYLPEADAFLLVTAFDSPLSVDEMRFFRAVASTPRRVFVVLNKQDTVNEQQRAEATDFVRRQLESIFSQDAPRVFPISALRALDAKQSHDPSQLEASGIDSLERELVNFLLTEKRSEFLLRMCDRLVDLVRGLPQSARTAEIEPRRVCWRLQLLRGWSDGNQGDDEQELFAGGSGSGGSDGAGASRRARITVGGDRPRLQPRSGARRSRYAAGCIARSAILASDRG